MLILILSHEATLKSWAIKYVVNASNSLYEHLVSHSKEEGNYTKYISGMGKSRAIDELSKIHLVVPLTLPQKSEGKFLRTPLVQALTSKPGFPATDEMFVTSFFKAEQSWNCSRVLAPFCARFLSLCLIACNISTIR